MDVDLENRTKNNPWTYRSADSLGNLPIWGHLAMYGGGGYVMEHGRYYEDAVTAEEQLYSAGWVDRYTRALIVEVILYNPHVNLFASVSLVVETPPSTSILTYTNIAVVRLHSYHGTIAIIRLVCEVIFVLYLTQSLISLILSLKKNGRRHFVSSWSYVDMLLILLSVVSVCMYIISLTISRLIMKKFSTNRGNMSNI